jgi:hypothetical protein
MKSLFSILAIIGVAFLSSCATGSGNDPTDGATATINQTSGKGKQLLLPFPLKGATATINQTSGKGGSGCNQWDPSRPTDPPKGQMTPRKSIGWSGSWEVLIWLVEGKVRGAQIHEGKNGTAYKIFFPTEKEARDFLKNPAELPRIEAEIEKCPWSEPSIGKRQKWLDF